MKLFLLPGMDGTGLLFEPLLSQLNKSIIPCVVSYPPSVPQDYSSLCEYVFSRIPQTEPFVLLGESFSGPIVFEIAARHPANLLGVIFVASFLNTPRPALTKLIRYLPWKLLLRLRTPDFVIRKFSLGKNASQRLVDCFRDVVRSVDHSTLSARMDSVSNLAPPDDVVDIPCIYIGGSNDVVIPKRAIDLFSERCENFEYHTIEGPHLLTQAAPELCSDIISRFIKKLQS